MFCDDQTTLIDLQDTNPLSKAMFFLPHYIVFTLLSVSPSVASNSSHTNKFLDYLKLSELPISLKCIFKLAVSLSSSTTTDLINRLHSIAESFHFHIYVSLGLPSK